ncbi:MAG: AI-2E family transporter [Rickettsiales bacterium]
MTCSPVTAQQQFVSNAIAGYLRGQVNVCLLLCVYYVVALGLVGMKYAVLVGLMAGLISFIPFVGALVSLATAAIIAFFQFGVVSGSFVAVLAIFAFGLVLENNILVPRLIGEKVGLHPAWVIFGMLTGAVLFGFVGILLAVPLTAVIGVLARFATERYRQSDYYLGKQRPKRSTTKA